MSELTTEQITRAVQADKQRREQSALAEYRVFVESLSKKWGVVVAAVPRLTDDGRIGAITIIQAQQLPAQPSPALPDGEQP